MSKCSHETGQAIYKVLATEAEEACRSSIFYFVFNNVLRKGVFEPSARGLHLFCGL